MHWADVTAQALAHKGNKHIISTGITPSGEFHIGHLREILTGDMISRAAKQAGLDVDFIFIVDDADPLRKVYPFLHEDYAQFIGHQIDSSKTNTILFRINVMFCVFKKTQATLT